MNRAVPRKSSRWGAAFLLFLLPVVFVFGQNAKPNFSGTWRVVKITRGPLSDVLTEIEQTESTFASRPSIPQQPVWRWNVYPIDGKVVRTKRTGHMSSEKTGHWDGRKLILDSSGEGNAPWRRSVTEEVISLSADGRIMTVSFHFPSGPEHDYSIDYEQVSK